MNHLSKINLIFKTSFVIPVMAVFSTLWCLMVLKLSLKVEALSLLTIKNFFAIVLTFNLLWILRLIDEIKDYDYDKVAHPERALPSGKVTVKDIWFYIFCFSFLGIIGAYFYQSLLIYFYTLTILYGMFLIKLESFSNTLKNNFVINLIITYPVNTLINLSLMCFYIHDFSRLGESVSIILVPFFAFLHYEFGRKTMRVSSLTKGVEFYSEQIGFITSLAVAVFVGVFAALSHLLINGFNYGHILFLSWPVIFGLLFATNLIQAKIYKVSAMAFILVFYLFVIVC